MTSLVLELQRDALDRSVPIEDLLRKALVVSRKLDLKDVQEWINFELNGYGEAPTPDYREARGELKLFNPFHGWQPVLIPTDALNDAITKRSVLQSIASITDLLVGDAPFLHMKFTGARIASIHKMTGSTLEPSLHLSRGTFVRILDAVRNKILTWSLDLESQGILGEGLTFTREEKAVAQQVNYHTHIGEMNNSQLQVSSSGTQTYSAADMKDLPAFIDAVVDAMGKLKLDAAQKGELDAELATLRAQLASPKPKPGIVREGLRSLKTIFEGAAGNVAASALLVQLAPLIGAVPT